MPDAPTYFLAAAGMAVLAAGFSYFGVTASDPAVRWRSVVAALGLVGLAGVVVAKATGVL